MTRTGKIARLPFEIRQELNLRLSHNLPARPLLKWLNSLPGVKKILGIHFEGVPISPQNLSEWRQGGFAEWQAREEIRNDARKTLAAAADLEEAAPLLADRAVRMLTALFITTLARWNGDPGDSLFAKLKHLSALMRELGGARRGDFAAARLKMDQHVFDLACEDRKTQRAPRRPIPSAPIQKRVRRPSLHPTPRPPLPTRAAKAKSQQIKPNQTKKNRRPFAAKKNPPTETPPAPASVAAPPSASHSSPSHPFISFHSSHPGLPAPLAIVTKPAVTIPPTPSEPARAAVTHEELWQMRYRDLPGDKVPGWRITLPIKTLIPPPQPPNPPPILQRVPMAH